MNMKTAPIIILTLIFTLILCETASAGTPLQQNQTGTVSGDLYVNTTNPWSSTTEGATNEVTQNNTLPTYTSIDSAWVYVNIYSGSGSSNWPVRTTVKFDGNGDGDYDDAGELLGVEDMNISGTTDGTVYWLNDHCNRVYSDYQIWYNISGLITSRNTSLYVKTENMGGDGYDGRIKMLTLAAAYNDGDTDKVDYWVLNGQDWINAATSPSTSTFNTSSFNGQVSSATLNTVALSGTDGTYTINGSDISGNLTETGTYYKENQWNVTSQITSGQNTTLTYAIVGSSLKMNLATLTIREEPTASDVIYENDFSTDPGLQIVNWLTSTSNADLGGVIMFNQSSSNILFECDMHYYRYPDGSGRYLTFGLINSTAHIFGPNFHFEGEQNNGQYWFTSNQVPSSTGTVYSSLIRLDMDNLVNNEWYHMVFVTVDDHARLQIYHGNDLIMEKTIVTNNNSWDGLGFQVCNYVGADPGTCSWNQTGGYIQMRANHEPDEFWIDNVLVKQYTGSPIADFSVNNTFGLSPATFQFTDQSAGVGINSWEWDFNNDGIVDSTEQNPTYTYSSPGNYTVKFTVTNAAGNVTIIRNSLITVSEPDTSTYNIDWQKIVGGTGNDYTYDIKQTTDGGCIVVGYTTSNDGDISGNHGGNDAIVVKYSPSGIIEWKKCLGTTGSDILLSIIQKTSGGYLAVGYTNSNTVPGFHSGTDAWIISIDVDGNIEWQKAVGGSSTEWLYSVEELSDGFILGGYTGSNNGDASGNHGGNDLWVLKIAPNGTIIWQKCFGGSATDRMSSPGSIKHTSDGGYIVTGYSTSNNGDVSGNHGNTDVWVLKLDSNGNIIWNKCFGGTNADQGLNIDLTSDGGYIVTGITSSTNIDVTNNHGDNDVWIIKLNADGDLEWQRCYGGNGGDTANILKKLSIDEYLIIATASSTDGDVIGNHGNSDIWFFKISSLGQLLCSQCFGGSNAETVMDGLEITNGGFIVTGHSNSSDGNLNENKGLIDIWTFKVISSGMTYESPVADFTADVNNGSVPLTVHFTDNSTGVITSIAWDFNNDGTIDSTIKNPTYTYTVPGTFTVKLTVHNPAGSDEEVKTDYITAVADPSAPSVIANPTSQELTSAIQVILTANDDLDPNPSIYYTTDGSDPTTNSTKYTNLIYIKKTTTLKFIAVDKSGNTSPMQTETYTDSQAPSTSVNIPGGNMTSSINVVLSAIDSVDSNPVIYYTTDGTNPTTNSAQYTAPINITKTTTLKFIAVDATGNTSPVQTETYTDSQAPSVVASPMGGTLAMATDVTLSVSDDVDPNPKIYYTLDGSDPTTSSALYTSPIGLPNHTSTTTLKFMAVDVTGNTSPVRCETYTIEDTVAPSVTANLNGTTVTLTATDNVDSNPAIYYTLDGSDPTTSSNLYTSPFTIPRAEITTVKFFAVDTSGNTSPVQTETLTGYYDKDLLTRYYAEGNVGVIVSLGDTGYGGGNPTYVLDLPEGATILAAHLCLAWNWYGYSPYTVVFNGNTVPNYIAHYPAWNGYVGLTDGDGQDVYDVTAYVTNGTNTAIIGHSAPSPDPWGRIADYGRVLIVVYQCASEPYRQIWINEGYHNLYYEGNTAYAFFNHATSDRVTSAQVTVMLPSGDNDAPNINFNGQTFTINSTGGSDPSFKFYNVTGALQNGLNELDVLGAGGYFSLQNAILTLTMQTAPVADFTGLPTTGTAPLTVQFTDNSADATDWSWDFDNNGTTDSTETNPTWTYNTAGTYTVKLTVTGPGGDDEETKTDYVTVNEPAPVAQFVGTPNIGTKPLQVVFTDTSTGTITSYAWDFDNNGTTDSTETNPTWTYNTAGTYTVKLTVTGPGGDDEETKTDYVTINEPAPVAQFTGTPNTGTAPLTVNFTDTSTGYITSRAWDFQNDGTVDSTQMNPTWTYNISGTYVVKLTVTGPGGTDSTTRTIEVRYSAPPDENPAPVAGFTANPTSGAAPLKVVFTDASTGDITSRAWDFQNDGTIDSTQTNPTYTYNTPGTYVAKLTVNGPGGSASKTVNITVNQSDTTAPVPKADPKGGLFRAAQTVALTATDDQDTKPKIYYTTNGAAPTTTSTLYTGPISITKTTMLMFIAVDGEGNTSPVQSETYTIDTTAPTINLVDPANSATRVALGKTIKVTFNEAIQKGSKFWIELINSAGKAIPFVASVSGKVLTIDPTGNLAESRYKLIIHTGTVTDLAGNPFSLKSTYFTTGTSPLIKSTDPRNNTSNLARNKAIRVTFNENIKPGKNYWIELKASNGTSVKIGKSISGKLLTITHPRLAANTKYTLILHTGAITDTAGNPMALKTISFTTGRT